MSADRQRVRSGLRPLPFRGDLIAAGAIPLAVGVVLLDLRMGSTWPASVRCATAAAVAALLLVLAWRAPIEGDAPRTYVSALLAAAFAVAWRALAALADLLGAGAASAGALTWTAAVLGFGYLTLARRRNSAICTLLGAGALVVAVLAATAWIFGPVAITEQRWVALLCVPVLALGVVARRDRARARAVALADVAGLSALWLGLTVVAERTGSGLLWAYVKIPGPGEMGWTAYVPLSEADDGGGGGARVFELPDLPAPATGWLLALLLVGFALVGYGAVDRERGPAWLGALVLVAFAVGASAHASVLWWPALLIALGLVVIVAGLRPTIPSPPSPDADATLADERRFYRD